MVIIQFGSSALRALGGLRAQTLLVLILAILIATPVTLLLPQIARATHGSGCTGNLLWFTGGKYGETTHYGAFGDNKTWNATVSTSSLYVNALEVIVDTNNLVEIGWHKNTAGGYDYNFVYWDQGNDHHHHNGHPSAPSDHDYLLWNSGNTVWSWTIDGTEDHTHDLSFSQGEPLAGIERHNACDDTEGDWWNLNKCNSSGTCTLWDDKVRNDSDPHAESVWPQDYKFYGQDK